MLTKVVLKKVVVVLGEVFGIPGAITERILNFLDKAATGARKVIGIIYILVAVIGAMIFALYFLTALKIFTILAGFILNMGLAAILIPFALISWAFKDTNIQFLKTFDLKKEVTDIFVGWSANLAMMAVIMAFCTFIIESLLMVETTIAGQVMTIKEYILLIGDSKNPLFGGPGIINIIWQNMDITLVFLCFGWVMSYLIKHVPEYTEYFFVGVKNKGFPDKIWGVMAGLFGKLTGVKRDTKTDPGNSKKGMSDSDGGDGSGDSGDGDDEYEYVDTEEAWDEMIFRIRNIVRKRMSDVSFAIQYLKSNKNMAKVSRYATDMDGESIQDHKKKFSDTFNQRENDGDFVDENGDDVLNDKDKAAIENYANNSKVADDAETTYSALSEVGRKIFVNVLIDSYDEKAIKDLARLQVANRVQEDLDKDIENRKARGEEIGDREYEKELNKKTKDAIKENSKIYEEDLNEFKNQDYNQSDARQNRKLLSALTEFNTDRNNIFKMREKFKKRKKSGDLTELIGELTRGAEDEANKAKIEEIKNNNVEKSIVLHEQELIIKTILENVDKGNFSDKELHHFGKLEKMFDQVNSGIDSLQETADPDYDPDDERIEFFSALMKNPVARKFLEEANLARDVKKLVKKLKSMDNYNIDLDDDADKENENADDDEHDE